MKRAVMVVDDDESVRNYLSHFLTSRGYSVEALESGDHAISRLSSGAGPAVVILDMVMPGTGGREVLGRIKKMEPALPVIILSGRGEIKTAVETMKMGASDFLVKPFEEQQLEMAIENALEKQKLKEEVRHLRQRLEFVEEVDILSSNAKMLRIKEIARQVADTDVPVLMTGESGVGKEVVARYIHSQSQASDKAFVKVNCAALPHDLLESELFGYEKGAFTGALSEKPGKFELADKGCIMLDEIAEMSSALQAKILHVLQDGEYSRLGGKRSLHTDARVLTSTNKRLEELVARGEFREDLYFRLNVIRIEIPPLRERKEDIPILCNFFLQKYRERYKSTVEHIPRDLMETFLGYDWPGNIRQLENAIKRYLILPELGAMLPELVQPGQAASIPPQDSMSIKQVAAQAAEQAEREMVLRVLDETNWNRKQAARRLGICYKALLNRLKKWQIEGQSRAAS